MERKNGVDGVVEENQQRPGNWKRLGWNAVLIFFSVLERSLF